MSLTFYPHSDDAKKGTLLERIEVLAEAAQRYKAVILDEKSKKETKDADGVNRRIVPRDLIAAFNWEEIAALLREIRELPEISRQDKLRKSELLTKLAEVYEVLRAAKMSKLEAVRLGLISEATQLRGGASQVA
jgi:hypothetical protein